MLTGKKKQEQIERKLTEVNIFRLLMIALKKLRTWRAAGDALRFKASTNNNMIATNHLVLDKQEIVRTATDFGGSTYALSNCSDSDDEYDDDVESDYDDGWEPGHRNDWDCTMIDQTWT